MKFKFLLVLFLLTPLLPLKSESREKMTRLGNEKVYSGASLRHIAFPIGGIGTGNVLPGGRGNILELAEFAISSGYNFTNIEKIVVKNVQMEANLSYRDDLIIIKFNLPVVLEKGDTIIINFR